MADEEKSLDEWLAEEQARQKKGFTYQPQPTSETSKSGAGDDVLAGLGIGAGVVGGAIAPHPNPVTFEGVKASVIAKALQAEVTGDDIRVQVNQTGDSTVVTILLSQDNQPYDFSPALTVTLLESADTLTVTLGDLAQDAKRTTLGSAGSTVVEQGKRLLTKRRGIGGLIETAGDIIEGVQDIVEDIQDLNLPKRVWEVIDRVGGAAEEVYIEERRKEQKAQWEREEAERAWTHCPACGRAYKSDEAGRVDCPSCGAVRGSKPDWVE